ncbi:glycogen debranching N-terminal domain-containing protein [Microbacterium tumbae]
MTDAPRQPLLHDAVIALHAPTQVWSASDGDLGSAPIHGIYHGDVRHVSTVRLEVDGEIPEALSSAVVDARHVRFGAVLRALDDDLPDPKVRLRRERSVADGEVAESIEISSAREVAVPAVVTVRIRPDFAPLQEVKSGSVSVRTWEGDGTHARAGSAAFTIEAPDAEVRRDGDEIELRWSVRVPPRGSACVRWMLRLGDPSLVVRGAGEWRTEPVASGDARVTRWLERALDDLGALRLALPDHPEDEFFAAGAPWFLTLFGRDSLWAARLAMPAAPRLAASTLRVLARLQGERTDPLTAEAPGKILHELRSDELAMPNEGIVLPPRYFGTVDATPLWVCLLADARDGGLPEDEVRELLPALRAALGWLTEHGTASGSGFIDYVDESGHGLANQGWKDSGDSIQWRDGSLAQGPIALCEVQGYAYEAATRGAEILEAFGEDAGGLRAWAEDLRRRFRASFWVSTEEGAYPAIALDAAGRPVDTLTSNIGHLIGTGILDEEEEHRCAELLAGPTMASGYGVRTLSTAAGGYWPLSYHGGSVWTHDTAILIHGMRRAGLVDRARALAVQLVDAAERFGYRVPELHSGDPAAQEPVPVPYPAACRPQAWSAAAAVVCAEALG